MSNMKDSNIAWIGLIPINWNMCRFKDHYKSVKEIAGKNSVKYDRLALTLNGVIKRNKDDSDGLQPKAFDTYQVLKQNDFVFKMIDLQNISTSRVGLSPYTGLVSPAYLRFSPIYEKWNTKYDYYFLISMYYNCVFNNLGGNGVRSALNSKDMASFVIPNPNEEIKLKIVDHLDKKSSQIDRLISNQEKQIENLKAYKQSLISETVTKGLNPNVKMKDSGIEWIGEIFQTHQVMKLKYLLSSPMQYGANESGSINNDNAVRYIRITDITNDGKLKDADKLYLPINIAKPYLLRDKNILFARSGGTVGKSFLYKSEYGLCAFAGYLIKAECDETKLLPEYLMYYTQSSLYEYWKNMIFIQATIQNIGANKYSNMEIPLPNIKQQKEIVEFLDIKCNQIDKLIEIKQLKIEKLNEYKKTLIYECVTGKKEIN